jgi:phosphatidylethanolamine-binding protein (PEBP) family uncharacterized protein
VIHEFNAPHPSLAGLHLSIKPNFQIRAVSLLFAVTKVASAHLIGDPAHDGHLTRYARNVNPPTNVIVLRAESFDLAKRASEIANAFAPFNAHVKTHTDEKFFIVESDGMPAHNMMVGITAWQQQVPLPQSYFGENAWRFPLKPVPAAQPQAIKNNFLRGAIALAVNGIPIFNPQNNRGEMSAEIGELDQWGGHCGRADDYHYHAAPFHLQSVVGKALPIAYALDGYAIYGITDPDSSTPRNLDSFNGHSTTKLGYHYHASTKYPYVNGGFHGEVAEAGGQVDPQPSARPIRQALPPLRGARIVSFSRSPDQKYFTLAYVIDKKQASVSYTNSGAGQWKFRFVEGDGSTQEETYRARDQRNAAPADRPRRDGKRPRPEGRPELQKNSGQNDSSATRPFVIHPKQSGNFVVSSSAVASGGALGPEFNGDGAGVSPPLQWKGAPAGTKSFALVMDHLAPGNVMKCYWTMWDIPANVTNLEKNMRGVGKSGASFRGQIGYEPPHSQGPGLKTYTIHIYALSAPPQLAQPPRDVTRELLLNAIKNSVLDSAELKVTYTRPE